MKTRLEDIKRPISNELAHFEVHFRNSMRSNVALLDKIMYYIVQRKGKQLRPMFVFLSAKLQGKVNDSTYVAASLVELLHTATLVHDDVVDDARKRRGFFSINALWKNKVAVLVGDYLLSSGLLLALDNGEYKHLQILSNAVRLMSEGELLQIEKARKMDIREDIYFEIIRQKTASLIAASCCAGMASVTENVEQIEKMRQFGEWIGIAFQIKDDLFDYGEEDIGKPLGIDIKEKKMTLPLIFALSKSTSGEKKDIIHQIKRYSHRTEVVKNVIEFVNAKGGMEYAIQKMEEYKAKALAILMEFPESRSRWALEHLVHYVTQRKK
ncbi:MAG TPA: polyprenyl synthetase family protein [Saprospiraceae bacterium]|nr:polyprenyl synthetase family protein [Saprospiraceae bacterium]